MSFIQKGMYFYADNLDNINATTLPSELLISERVSYEAVLIRLLCGTLKIKHQIAGEEIEKDQRKNYSVPGNEENTIFKKTIIRDFFSFDHYRKLEKESIDKYLSNNRRNTFIHSELLSELTSAIIWAEVSPVEAFVHIYRALEFMSYSFPLIYASKSMDYRGSYNNLKKFMGGDKGGELKFFKTFLAELFKDNILFGYEFEMSFLSEAKDFIQQELQRVINGQYYTFDGNTMKIKFANIIDLVTTLRNKYFHMLLGPGTDNFYDIRYDKREIFYVMNPVFINWLTIIYKEIVVYSVGIV